MIVREECLHDMRAYVNNINISMCESLSRNILKKSNNQKKQLFQKGLGV